VAQASEGRDVGSANGIDDSGGPTNLQGMQPPADAISGIIETNQYPKPKD